MKQLFVAQIKIYSGYSGLLHAPFGFDGPSQALEPKRWFHIPTDGALLFSIHGADEKTITLKVLKNHTPIELINVSLIDSDRYIQFSARSPSISCKYIVQQAAEVYVKRFQMVLHNDNDFNRTCAALFQLRFLVKGARPTISLNPVATYASKRLLNTVPEPMCSQQPLSYPEEILSLESYQNQFNCTANTEKFSQNVDAPVSQQFRLDDIQRTSMLNGTDLSVSQDGNVMAVGSDKMVNSFITASTPKQVQMSVKTLDAVTKCPMDSGDGWNILKKINKHTNIDDNKTKVEMKTGTQEHLEALSKEPDRQLLRERAPEIYAEGKQENAKQVDAEQKDLKMVSISEFKISKKMIKQKLKDEKFLSWVNKVESVLLEMSKTKS